MTGKYLFVTIIIASLNWYSRVSSYLTPENAIGDARHLYANIISIQKGYENLSKDEERNFTKSEQDIIKRLKDTNVNVLDVKNAFSNKVPRELESTLMKLFEYINDIQRLYNEFLNILTNYSQYPRSMLEDFATVSTRPDKSEIKMTIKKMHDIFLHSDANIADSVVTSIWYGKDQSPYQLLYIIYKSVVITQTIGVLMSMYGYRLREILHKENCNEIMEKEFKEYEFTIGVAYNNVRNILHKTSREIRRIDPRKHVYGVTYSKLESVFQGYFMYEPDTHFSLWRSTFRTCSSIVDGRLKCNSLTCTSQPKEKRCRGHLRNCEFVAKKMQICHSPVNSDNRYEWMQVTETNELYGPKKTKCSNTQGISSILMFDTCLCVCESDKRNSDRYFSLRGSITDLDSNKVVTGLRFIKRHHVIYLQIQEGVMGPNGVIIRTPRWRRIETISRSLLLSDAISTYHHKKGEPAAWTEFKKNKFVYTVTYGQSSVFLDDLEAPDGYVMTGVKLQQIDSSLRFTIRITQFDFQTGRLMKNSTIWIANENNIMNRQQVVLVEPDSPIRSKEANIIAAHNQYVIFNTSDIKKDLKQNTIPFLDVQPVVTNPPLPLTGAGLFHKAQENFGGFLAVKLFHYDFLQNVN